MPLLTKTLEEQEKEDRKSFLKDIFAKDRQITGWLEGEPRELSDRVYKLSLFGLEEGVEKFKQNCHKAGEHKDAKWIYDYSMGLFGYNNEIHEIIYEKLLNDTVVKKHGWEEPQCNDIAEMVSSRYPLFVSDKADRIHHDSINP